MNPVEAAQKAVERADLAYTAAVQAAAQTGQWGLVSAAHQAVDQARAALEPLLKAAGLA